jgi:hypothetical protein
MGAALPEKPPRLREGSCHNAYLGNIKSQVDETTWETWWAEGKALSQEEVSTLALTAITEIQRSQ